MPKIRHLAIRTEDTGKLAKFYMDVFEMQILHKDKQEGGVIYLTDGYFNLAILPNHDSQSPNGLYHFGFEVENGEKIVERLKKYDPNKLPKQRPNGRPYAETRTSDIDGNFFDISEHGFSYGRAGGRKEAELKTSARLDGGQRMRLCRWRSPPALVLVMLVCDGANAQEKKNFALSITGESMTAV